MPIYNLLAKIIQIINNQNIPYMLGGSMAMNFYTVTRTTRDIDIVIHLQQQDVDKLLTQLENFYYNRKAILEEVQRQGMFNVIDNATGFKVDFIIRKNNEYSLVEFERRRYFDDLGFGIWVCSLEDLIVSKIKWIQQLYSERQAIDIQSLLQNDATDINYVKHWCNKLHMNTFDLITE